MFPRYLKNPLVWPFLVPLVPIGLACSVVDKVVTAVCYR